MNESDTKWVVGLAALLFAVGIAFPPQSFLEAALPLGIRSSVLLVLGGVVGIAFYLFMVRGLIFAFSGKRRSIRGLLNWGILCLVAGGIWLLLTDLFLEFVPIEPGYVHVPSHPWGLLSLAVPLGAAYLFLRVSSRMLRREPMDAPNEKEGVESAPE